MIEKPTIVRRVVNLPQSGLMTLEQTAAYLGKSVWQLQRMLAAGKGPPQSALPGNPTFLHDEVERWLRRAA